MATSDAPDDDAERCSTAFEAVSDVAMEHCNTREAVLEAFGKFLGIDPEEVEDMKRAGGLTDDICDSTREVRKWVLVRTAEIVEEEGPSVLDAMDRAWDEARDGCEGHHNSL